MPGLKRAKDLFKKVDFESTQCLVVMRNITTSTDLPKGQRPELAQVGKTELVILVPEGTCSEGHLLLLRLFDEQEYVKVRNSPRSVQDKAQLLAITGRVSGVEAAPGQKSKVTLALQQSVDKEWQRLLASLSAEKQGKAAPAAKKAKQKA